MARSSGPKPKIKRLPRRVFISYARKDGTDTAQQLWDVLQGAGCDVWLDTERIRGGASWSKDTLDEAIHFVREFSFDDQVCIENAP